MGTGYRIQIIQTTDPEEARNVERDAILRFDEEVYRVFDPPFYKVRVGDFVNWNDAEKVQKVAIRRGFRDAWVIRTKINLKKAYGELEQF
ncbi:MAG: SPOR domain-containing protein [Caldithrix sp.]|nr:MAG: SPOR domain-containing protein [Caldithrix sp.]